MPVDCREDWEGWVTRVLCGTRWMSHKCFQKPKWKVKQTVNVQVELKGVDINFESHQYRDGMSWNWLRSYVSIEHLTIKPETFP